MAHERLGRLPEWADAAAGRVGLPDRYVDLGPIARGGWGEVRRLEDRALERVVAIKVLAKEHLEAPSLLARFLNEAKVTASLEHPGIVPIHDRGVLEDGRPWFTMKEVRGRTLHQILFGPPRDRDELEPTRRLRRLVEILHRVAETVGYAHERGVLHRDLKPGNIMVGEFGEVLVLDWGVARWSPDDVVDSQEMLRNDAALTGTGEILGTIAYMSPEQGRGLKEPLTPASDVFSLGIVLYEILTGERARPPDRVQAWAMAATGSVPAIAPNKERPEELTALVGACTSLSPEARPADGRALSERLRDWLDGSMRRERAAAVVAEALRADVGLDALRERERALRAEAKRIHKDLREPDPVEKKRPAWALEDEAAQIAQQLHLAESDRIEALRAALELDPDNDAAHRALAAIYRERVLEAEARRAPAEAERAARRFKRHDRGENPRFLRGVGRLVLACSRDGRPAHVTVHAARYRDHERRLIEEAPVLLGHTPLDVELEAGSLMLVLDGRVRLPVRIERDRVHQLARPDGTLPAIVLPPPLPEDEIYVPGSFSAVGGDAQAIEPVPARTVWIDGFVIQRDAVTIGAYLAFLDGLDAHDAARFAPRWQVAATHDRSLAPSVERIDGKHRVVREGEGGQPMDLSWPVTSIDWHGATAYAAYLSARTGQPWRLPDELEWEKAARGADGRFFPWGDYAEPTWARIVGSTDGAPSRARVGSHPVDVSPYGARDLAGNARAWCANAWTLEGPEIVNGVLRSRPCEPSDPAMRAIRGGAWSSPAWLSRSATRFAGRPDERFAAVGVRLVRSL